MRDLRLEFYELGESCWDEELWSLGIIENKNSRGTPWAKYKVRRVLVSASSTCQCCGTKGSTRGKFMLRGGYWSLCFQQWSRSALAAEWLYWRGVQRRSLIKGTGRVVLFLTSLWILEFLRNQRETKNHRLQNACLFWGLWFRLTSP